MQLKEANKKPEQKLGEVVQVKEVKAREILTKNDELFQVKPAIEGRNLNNPDSNGDAVAEARN